MARRFRRFQGRRRGRRGKRSWFGRAGKALALAGSALAVARGVKSLMNIEYKVHERDVATTASTTAGSVVGLSLIAEGDDNTDRNGRSVRAKSLDIHCSFKHNVSGVAGPQWIRFVIFMDMHGDGTTPDITDVFTSTDLEAFRNLDNTDRYKVLMDKNYVVSSWTAGGFTMKKHFRLNNKLEFIGTGDTVADAGAGSIWAIFLGDQAAYGPYYTFASRLRYIDN